MKSALDQYFTPSWAAELLVARHFSDLDESSTVWEPCAGDGRFLMAVPGHVNAFGTEIDPAAAMQARDNSGRLVLAADFRDVVLPEKPTAIISNPPFRLSLVQQLLDRAAHEMDFGARVGLLLPVYMFQTAATVMNLARTWSIGQELVPRDIYAGLQKPLLWATFTKERDTALTGFYLYQETAALRALRREYRERFIGNGSRANVWRETIAAALQILGGRGTLKQIYGVVENDRPTGNTWWREQIRKQAARWFHRVGQGEYSLEATA